MKDVSEPILLVEYSRVRANTQAMVERLDCEDMVIQTMPDVSPTKWHLAHTSWFWETFLLLEELEGYREYSCEYNYLFNSYYDAIGERHPRNQRGFLSRPGLADVLGYRRHVDEAMTRLLSSLEGEPLERLEPLLRLGLAHEEQHQELILTDIKHVLSHNPFAPQAFPETGRGAASDEAGASWIGFDGGLFAFGVEGLPFQFDNEGPRHEALLTPFALADRPVTNGEYAAFINDGGYRTPSLWLSDGWARVNAEGWQAPLYWHERDGAWRQFTLHGEAAPQPDAPVAHLSFYEAAAYAEWAGARLPSEREWELAAQRGAGPDGRFAMPGWSAHPDVCEPGSGLRQMFGGVWEWTRSDYAPYPRYRPAAGAVGEYNGKFMSGQYVLRGGSCATSQGHIRPTYRNFFPPQARWQFSGLRLAKDI
ncbi:ergothioneine biosynthesis protein EgtB [Maricaulis salignorans]|uniref:Ergothioneine biosynthesis protein EgtB n=1 Tax=Maricaulis salignorans TaxID=144026 RepID=A0A1G9U8D1_9PROT|nr:ergothioneine biosynthesis protein EgtB [Maricaulis salignorans]